MSDPDFDSEAEAPALDAPRVRLRSPRNTDVAERFELGQDPEILLMFGCEVKDVRPLSLEAARKWVDNLKRHPCAWVIEHDGRFIGELRFDAIDQRDRRARLAVGIYDPTKLSQGLGKEAIHAAIGYAFAHMDLHRISLRVIDYNGCAIGCYKSVGFVEEGREREAAFVGGKWHDDVIMGLLRQEYQQPLTSENP